jgi:hypothetical protein
MAKRSTRVTLSNNTSYPLMFLGSAGPCHGKWTEGGWNPPDQIQSKEAGAWETQSDGFLTGTEGWVKYLIATRDPRCAQQLVYIHWDNPFVWSGHTNPIDFQVSNSDIKPPCDSDKGVWGVPGGFSPGGVNQIQACQYELFPAGASGSGISNVTWWDVLVNWPVLLGLTVLGQADINLEFIVGLRQKGSVDQTIFSLYDGKKGLRAITDAANQPSLRKLFRM